MSLPEYWELGEGHRWEPILMPLCRVLEHEGYVVTQVKIKFGIPCVYLERHAEFGLPDRVKRIYDRALARCTDD